MLILRNKTTGPAVDIEIISLGITLKPGTDRSIGTYQWDFVGVATEISALISAGDVVFVEDGGTELSQVESQNFAGSLNVPTYEGFLTSSEVSGNFQDISEKNAANGYAGLDGSGLLLSNQLPPLAITSTYVVASEVAQLALTVQEGDIAVRSDLNQSYIALNDINASLADWQLLLTPTDAVLSVAGKTGVVVLDAADITSGTFADARIAQSNVTQYEGAINHDALLNYVANEHLDWTLDLGATNINDGNITQSAVTQHQAALSITESQISDLGSYVDLGSAQTITGQKTFSAAILADNIQEAVAAAGIGLTANNGAGDGKASWDGEKWTLDVFDSVSNLEFGWIQTGDPTTPEGWGLQQTGLGGTFFFMSNAPNPQILVGDDSNTGFMYWDGNGNKDILFNALDTGPGAATDKKTGFGPGGIFILAASGGNQVNISAPALAADYDLVLPADDGTPNQFLQTDGAGNLTWASGGGGATELNDLTDVQNVTPADRHVLIYDGVTDNRYENRLLVEADISDLGPYNNYVHPNHTGEVTSIGDGAQALDPTAISNKTSVTAAETDEILIGDASDAGNLKKVTAQSIADLADISVEDEGVELTAGVESFDFAGEGVTATEPVTDQILVTIPGTIPVEDDGVALGLFRTFNFIEGNADDAGGNQVDITLNTGWLFYVESTTTQSTSSETLQTYLTLNFTTAVVNEVFDLFASLIWRTDDTSTDYVAEIQLDDTLIGANFRMVEEPQDAGSNQRKTAMMQGRITVATAGAHTIKIKFANIGEETSYTYAGVLGLMRAE